MYTTIFPQAIMTDQNSSSNQIKYPEDIQIIIRSDTPSSGSLFISNLQASRNQQLLEKLKIGAIICLSKGNSIKHPSYLIKYSKYIPLEEGENVHISEYLEESTCFIDQNLRLTNVLVHCISGISKSPCFVIAYLMKNRKLTLEDAFNEVKSRRKIIRLDQNLISQLKHYQSLMRQRKGQQKQRMTTNQKRSNILDKSQRSKSNNLFNRSCNIHAKSLITDKMQAKEVNQSKMTQRLKASQFNDDRQSIKSYKSSKSNLNDRSQINIEVLKPIDTQNPEKSFLSKRQGLQKSILQKGNTNKSSISQKFNRNELQIQMDDLPQLTMSKKTSSSRQEYARKVMHIDNRNSELNKKIIMIQGKFEDQSILNQKKLQTELQVINELRSSLLNTQNERKIKFRQKARIDLHDKTMEDRYVQAYIQNIGNQYSITQNY